MNKSKMAEIQLSRDLFLWSLSVIYLFAFASLFVQIPGLYGEHGILPARLVLQKEAESFSDLVNNQPTLLRLLPKVGLDLDTGMDFLCMGGAMLAFVAMVSKDQRNSIVFAVLWMFYLSLFQIGQAFLWFQWDILLLEAGFLAILISPLNFFGYLDISWRMPHDSITMWLARWLLFRQSFASGISKLATENSTWLSLTALNDYYQTQHLPTPLAWYFHQFPDWIQSLGTVLVLAIQIPISLFYFSPYKGQRLFAFYAQCLLCTLTMLSGNYGFYTLLILTLSVSLLDDDWLHSWTNHRQEERKLNQRNVDENESKAGKYLFYTVTYGGLALLLKYIFSIQLSVKPPQISTKTVFSEKDVEDYLNWLTPLTIVVALTSLGYEIWTAAQRSWNERKRKSLPINIMNLSGCLFFGLIALSVFAISVVPHSATDSNTEKRLPDSLKELYSLTSENYKLTSPYMFSYRGVGVGGTGPEDEEGGRLEVVLEGSNVYNDDWKEYNFRFKPGNVSGSLPIVSPHQPRLDWQMWFLSRDDYEHNHWLLNLVYRLLTNQKEVLELLDESPFPDDPPKYIRATLYRYHFTSTDSTDDKYSPGSWWVREPVGEYMPILSLDEPTMSEYVEGAGLEPTKVKRSKSNFLRGFIQAMRSLLGQGNGSTVCMVLVITGFLLTLLDPSINLLGHPPGMDGLPNGQPYRNFRTENEVK